MPPDQAPSIRKRVRLVPLGVFAVAAVLHFAALQLSVFSTWWLGLATGFVLAAGGGLFVSRAEHEMRSQNVDPGFTSVLALVTSGPFAISRNPMYLGSTLMYAGLSLAVNSWWPLILLPGLVLATTYLIIVKEERYLGSVLPDQYAAYRQRVRRWI